MSDVAIERVSGDGDYPLCVRRYRPDATAVAQVILLHGVVSHSEWLDPLARLLCERGIDVVCPDRRGTGLNELDRGDAPDSATLVADIERVRQAVALDGVTPHLGGFCWGATYAIACLERAADRYASLVMIAPSVFPVADVGDEIVTGDSGEASLEPNVPIDRFTSGPRYEDYIIPDPLKTRLVSPRFNSVMVAMNRLLGPRWAKLDIPTLVLLASDDRLSDNSKHERAFAMLRANPKKKTIIAGEHGLQFDAPETTAAAIADWAEPAAA
ncbi:MAG: alpha/beta fold hydrolase [Woeseiaceae bacterium]|nr:alpha/beta fold hydrolase [Woeseiaceae bacterium]